MPNKVSAVVLYVVLDGSKPATAGGLLQPPVLPPS